MRLGDGLTGTKRWLRRALVLVVCIAIAAPTACSDDDAASSEQEFGGGFARVTTRYEARTAALKKQGNQAVGQGIDRVLPVYESMLAAAREAHDGFAELAAPASLASDVEHLVSVLDRQQKVLGQVVEQAKAGKSGELGASLQELTRLLVDFAKVHQQIEQELAELDK